MMLSRRGWAPRLVAVCLAATSRATATLVAYYSFDDGTAADDGDGSLDGIVSGATASTGPDGSGALSFDGSNDYVKFPDALTSGILGSNARTVCLWAAISSFDDAALFTFGDYADGEEFALMTAASAGGFIVQLYGSDYDTDVSASGCENILTIGVRDGESYLTGSVDELYVYSSALSESEIQTLYVGDTLIAYYSFDDGTAAEDSDSSLDGTISGATATTGRDGSGALSFDGVDDYVEFPDTVTADIAGDSARTVCLWAAIDAFNGGGLFMYGGSDYNAEYGDFGLAADVVSGSVEITISATLLNNLVALSGSDDGDWHHYCISYDGATLALYYDAALAYSGAAELATSDSPLEIGGGSIHLSGSIDEVYAYTSALDADAIEELYDSYGVSPNPTPAPTPTPTPEPTPTPTPRPTVECLRVSFSERVIAADLDSTEAVYAVDVDGDGDVDALAAGAKTKAVVWYENDGAQSFTERIITDSVDDALPVYALDVDGDGDADVLSGSSSDNTFSWYENDAAQSFTERAIAVLADSAKSVFAIDFDDDGDVDALAACEGGSSIAWYENDGSQSFTERVISDEADGVASVQAIDIDGDGDVDGVSALADGNAVVWCENDGAQSFTGHEVAYGGDRRLTDSFSSDASDSISLVAADSLVSGAQCAFAIDVDGDGDVDVLSAAYDDDAIAWHENDGSQGFTEHVISDEADGAHSVYAIDADGDGDIDVLAAYYDSNEVAWHENDGAESFAEHVITDSAASAAAVFAIDADGDGDVDVLSASAGDATIAWYENDCDSAPPTAAPTASAAPTLSPAPTLSWPPTPRPTVRCLSVAFSARAITEEVESPRSVFAIDVDGDGDVDVLSASEDDDTVAWYENDGSQSFSDHLIVDTADGAMSVFAIDVDGDGDVDALSRQNDGTESFAERVISDEADGPYTVFVIDVDGDGDVDALSASYSGDMVAWYENDGAQSFAARVITDSADSAVSVIASDLDQDGDVDVLSTSTNDNTVAWYENDCATRTPTASPSVSAAPTYPVTPRPTARCASVAFSDRTISDEADNANSVFAIDVDGDGDVDVLSASQDDDTVAWYENDGSQSFTERIITAAADQAACVFAIDVDDDGDVDVLSASYNDDTIAWYENYLPEGFADRVITAAANEAWSVYAIDVDGDGDVDVLSASRNDDTVACFTGDTVAWYENDGAQSFAERVVAASQDGPSVVFAIDLDGDDDVDAVSVVENDDAVMWFENDGQQAFAEFAVVSVSNPLAAFAIDVDNDGDVDVLHGAYSNDVSWHENDGQQSFTAKQVNTGSVGQTYTVYATDVDGDGDVDALSACRNNDNVFWYENDCATFAPTSTLVAHYSFDDGAASEDTDGDLDGTVSGATASDGRGGETDGALYFDGNSYVEFPSEWSFYVDGAVAHAATASLDTGSENPLTVGRRDGESYLTGSVDELYVYSSALSESEVQALYFQDTLVAYYSFDDGTAADDLGGLDGTIHGATATTGQYGSGALSFDGEDDYVEFPSAVTTDILGSDPRTVCLWAMIDAFNDGGLFEYGSSAPDQALAIRTAGDSSVYVELYGSGAVPTSDATDGDWHHYCLTYDGSDWAFYFDGSQAETGTHALDTGSDNALRLGQWNTAHYFDGSIDEVYVFSISLDEASIQVLYDARDAFVVPELDAVRRAVALSERESVEWSFFLSERESVEQSFFEPERGAFFEPERGAIFESFCDAERGSVRGAVVLADGRAPALRRAVVLADGRALRRALAVPEREPFEQPFFDALRGAVGDAFRHSVVEPLFVSERSSDHRADGFVRANHERRHGIDVRPRRRVRRLLDVPRRRRMRDGRHRHTGVLYFVVVDINLHACADGDADDGGAFDGRSDHGITDDGVALDARAVDGRAHDGPSDDGRADDGRALDRGALDRGADDSAHGGAFDGGAFDGGAFDGGAFDGGAFDGGAFDDHAFDDHAFDDHAFDGGAVDVPADDVGTDSESDETVVDAVPDARAVAAAGKSHRKSSDREPERRTDATEYELAVTAVDVEAGTNATSTVALTVNRADVVAIIAGGSRVVPLGALELSAADSYDEDDPDGALVFSWSLLGEAFAGEVLELDGLAVGEYVFHLNATSADGRFGSTSATIELVDDDPPAVAVAFDFYRVAATDKVVLYGDARRRARRWRGVRELYVARPPSSGKLEVLPAAGFALETTFALATYSWVTEDAPLQYAFKTRVNGSESTLQVATRQPSLENVVLPEGSPNVTVVVVATDALGGEAEAAAGVRVSPTELGVALANLTTSLLDSAFALGNTEGVCQTVVAAAGAADAALTATLIDAVAAIASDIDADESLIEQTASALVSVAANGTGLGAAAASSALDSVGILANISVGITAVAAASLGDALSGVLESELFAAYTSPNASNSSSRRLAESAGDTLGLALDGIARAQLNGAVEGEFASEVKSTKLRMSSQKLSTLGGGGDRNRSKVSLALGASSVSTSNQTGGNATCPPGGGGNVSFACADGSVLSAPCPATGVREATVVSFTCPFTEAGCAFWDGSAWSAPPDCETVVDGGDVTCVCAVVDDALDFSATSNSVLGTYASAFTSLSGRDLVSSPLLYWTVFTMALGCFVVGVIGFFLDRRDAAKKSDNAAKKGGDIGCLSLEGLVAESMPGFVEELGHPFAWACRMLWKNHSWCKILSTHMPANPRPRRCVTLFFSLLMIMFGQAIAFWFAYPVGFCDGAEFQRNCEAKKTLYAEFVAVLTGEEVVRDACVWYVLEFATHFFTVRFRYDVPPEGTTEFCQLRTPEAQDIGFKRLLLIFLGVIMAIPFTEIFDATFVKYVCAPLKSCGYVHVLTGVAKRDAIAAFARFDTDGSGAIDSYELVCAMEAMGLPKPSNKDVSRMMSGAEELDRDQFLAMMAQHPKMMARAAALGANVVDVEGDGENVAYHDEDVGANHEHLASRPHVVGQNLWRNLGIVGPSVTCEELPPESYYALRAVLPVMIRVLKQRAELVDAYAECRDADRRAAVGGIQASLDRYWGISQSEIAETATTFGERVKAQLTFATAQTFAERVFHHLVESQQVAVAYGRRARSVGDDRRAARVIINMMRREFFSATEVKIFEQQLAPTFRRDEGEPERLPPVSLSAKVVATMLCLGAFLGPMLFLSIFASAVGNAMTRAWYVLFEPG
ncbi:hypothetical protein JL721_929 [Aureococcus anophagefferens]|nr:hypothetical protein JL721_929 [Aureococcus anophagefferens]